jgi:hypothetical protein
MLGQRNYEHERVPFGSIGEALRTRRIDVVAPFMMRFPRRLGKYRFSKPLPMVTIGMDGIVPKKAWDHFVKIVPGGIGTLGDFPQSEVSIFMAQGEVAEAMADILFPAPNYTREFDRSIEHAGYAIDHIMKAPFNTKGQGRILLSNTPTCKHAKRKYGESLVVLSEQFDGDAIFSEMQLPLAFTVHPDEPELAKAIDECIDLLENSAFFANEIENAKSDPTFAELAKKFPELNEPKRKEKRK